MDGYAEVMAPMFRISPMASDVLLPHNFAGAWQTDRFVLGIGESNPFSRQHEKREIQNGGHLIEVSRYIRGTEKGYSGDSVINRVPGPIYVRDQEHPYHTVVSQFKVQQLYVPKAVLNMSPDALRKPYIIKPSGSLGTMIHTCMDELYEGVRQSDPYIDRDLAERFLALLKINMGVHPMRGDVRTHFRSAMHDQICIFIEQNLGDTNLSASSVLRSFGLSRASLYRMFEDDGGVRNYIMERRAVRAVLDISKAPHVRGQARRASDRWGFSTQPNFNRTIRRLFKSTPGRLFAPGRDLPDIPIGQPRMFKRFTAKTAIAA